MPDSLDNPIWHALTGPHAHLAIGRGAARRYPHDIAPFAAIAASTSAAYADLAHDMPLGQAAILFRSTQEPEPPGWEAHDLGPLDQMILPSLPSSPVSAKPRPTILPLVPADIPDMLALIDITKPGPFAPRTKELGHYIGIRDSAGRLVGMAGERLRLPGYVELSAICVHPDARGQGLAATLTLQLARPPSPATKSPSFTSGPTTQPAHFTHGSVFSPAQRCGCSRANPAHRLGEASAERCPVPTPVPARLPATPIGTRHHVGHPAAMRLTHPTIRPTGQTISFHFNRQPIEALQGETIAAALSAAEITTFRRTPSGAPRGLFCGMGACFDCVVTVNGRIGQRACLTEAAEGMQVRGDFPTALTNVATSDSEDRHCDVLVVGAGVAGLSAATAAAQAGASVVVLDERGVPGGQFAKSLAPSHRDTAPDKQFRLGLKLCQEARRAGARLESDAPVWGAFAPNQIAALVRGQSITYRPRRLILATGAHEAPVPIPGWTLPGVLTTGGLQTLARTQRVSPGARVLIAGNGPLNLQLACELLAGGIKPVAVLEAAPRPTAAAFPDLARMLHTAPGLVHEGWSMLRRLKRAGVPLLWDTMLDRLDGDTQVQTAVTGHHRFEVDIVALNMGFQPEVNLSRALGVPQRYIARGAGHLAADADAEGRTAVAGVFTVGDGAKLGGARVAQARGYLAGLAAARDLGFHPASARKARAAVERAETFQAALWRVFAAPQLPLANGTIVCRCEEITAARLRAEIAAGLTSLPALKKATRAGMGRCQGRFCAATIARMCPSNPEPDGFAAPRAPLRPVSAAPLMRQAPEFEAPLLPNPAPPVRLHALPPLPLEARHADIAVIGAGVAGLSTAYYLAQGGADVLLIDRDEAAMAASTANAGSLHVQLLSYDFNDDTPADGGPAAHTLPLGPRGIALWKEIAAAAGEDLGIRTDGGLMLAENEAAMAWLRRKSAMEQSHGIESHILGSNELRTLAPALSDRMLGADFVPAEGYGDPLRGMMALLRLVQAHGTRLLRGAEVHAIERAAPAWRITTSKGTVTAGRIVNATGPWAARTGRMVGLDLPVTGTVQQVIVTEPAPPHTRHLVAIANRHLSLKQQSNGSFLIGGGWFGDFHPATGRTNTLQSNIQGNLWVCERALPAVKALSIVRAWTGINPAIDRAPLLGEAPGHPGFYNTVTANGYTLGPAVGEITAQAILHNEPIDPRYQVTRFN